MIKMKRREFIKSAAVAAGLVVVGVSQDVAKEGQEFYVADWSENKKLPDRNGIVTAFRRAMDKHGFTRIYDIQYKIEYHIDRIAYLHIWSAKLI